MRTQILCQCERDQLVLVDISGSGDVAVINAKVEKLTAWIADRKDLKPYEIHGIVLAPNVNAISEYKRLTRVGAIYGKDARSLMVGVSPIAQWL